MRWKNMFSPSDVGLYVLKPELPELWCFGFPETRQVSTGGVEFDGAGRNLEIANDPACSNWSGVYIFWLHSASPEVDLQSIL